MEMQVSRSHEAYIITLSGRWDTFSSVAFEQKCATLIQEGMRLVVIDVAEVDYVSSFGLRSLLNIGKLLEPLQGRVHMSSLQPQVRKVFVGSGFSSLFPEYPDVNTALRAFKDKA
ncbi:STAS domain-containing protein [Solidesulfovibrio sp. C21]|uniref:STAS domain-containing protein n=1 Tax=Solidesulfovibrio sp. C21 TaxID=3398613 RepID=UPI0039FC8A26